MATTAPHSMKVGTLAPSFALPDVVTQKEVTISGELEHFSKGIVIIFLCCHCPYVKHLQEALISLAKDFMPQGIGFLGINSNDFINYPQDSPQRLREMALEKKFPFPLLSDETQEVAKNFNAACTPEFFLFDGTSRLVYHGRFDASTPKNEVPVTGNDLRFALESLLKGHAVSHPFPLAIGCGIKWKE